MSHLLYDQLKWLSDGTVAHKQLLACNNSRNIFSEEFTKEWALGNDKTQKKIEVSTGNEY